MQVTHDGHHHVTLKLQTDEEMINSIKNAPIAELFKHVLFVQHEVQNQIDAKKHEVQELKKYMPHWRAAKITYGVLGIVSVVLKPIVVQIYIFARHLLMVGVFVIGYCALADLAETRQYKINLAKYDRKELQKTMGHINTMLDILRHLDRQDNPETLSNWFRSLSCWHLCQEDSTPKFEDFFSVLHDYLPGNDQIKSLIAIVSDQKSDLSERKNAWSALENEMQTVLNYIRVDNVFYSRPGKEVNVFLAYKGSAYKALEPDRFSVIKFA